MYLQLFTIAVDLAIFPHDGRHPHTGALQCDSELEERKWAAQQVRECMTDPALKHAELGEALDATSPKTLQRLSRRRYPAHFTATTPPAIFEMWRIIRNRRTALRS